MHINCSPPSSQDSLSSHHHKLLNTYREDNHLGNKELNTASSFIYVADLCVHLHHCLVIFVPGVCVRAKNWQKSDISPYSETFTSCGMLWGWGFFITPQQITEESTFHHFLPCRHRNTSLAVFPHCTHTVLVVSYPPPAPHPLLFCHTRVSLFKTRQEAFWLS